MDIQLIITYAIILGAIYYTLQQTIKLCAKDKSCGAGGCSGCGIKKEIKKNLILR